MFSGWVNFKNAARYHPKVRYFLARVNYLCARRLHNPVQALEWLSSAARLYDGSVHIEAVESLMLQIRDQALSSWSRQQWAEALAGPRNSNEPVRIPKAAIIKPFISNDEPGVIFISFEHQWAKLLHLPLLDKLAQQFTLVVSPTWSPPHNALNIVFPELWPEKLHCLISNHEDLTTFPRLSSKYQMVSLYASNWVDEHMFEPLPKSERDIDLVMLANFALYKRHYLLFSAIRSLPENLKIVLVGQPNGKRDLRALMREAAAYGIQERFTVRCRVSDEEVIKTLCRSKASVILSQREGSCVAVVESMFADTPVGLVRGCHIGSAAFINSQTGCFLDEQNLAADLLTLIRNAAQMEPRSEALRQGLGARSSSARLNAHLADFAKTGKRSWSRDIWPLHWRPNPQLLSPADLAEASQERVRLKKEFGIILGSPDI